MERHANYALVGSLTVGLLVAAIVFILWLGNDQFGKGFDHYRAVFDGPVRGLTEGSEVDFNGIKVGEITKLRVDPSNSRRVIIDVKVEEDTPIRVDTFASKESQGVTGVSIIQLTPGSPTRPLLRDASREQPPIIRAKPGSLDSVLEAGGQTLAKVSESFDRVNRVLSDRNIAKVDGMLADIRSVTAELNRRKAMFADAQNAIRRLDSASGDIEQAAAAARTAIQGDGTQAFADIREAAANAKSATNDARAFIAKLNASAEGLEGPEGNRVAGALRGLEKAAESLDRLTRQIQQDPRSVLGRGKAREMELPK